MALILRNGGSQSPDRWLREPRNNQKSWMKSAKEHEGTVPTRGSGNYASDEAKEIARLQRELRDTKDALEVLKKAIGILGK